MAQTVVLLKCTPGWNLSQPRQNLQVKNEFHLDKTDHKNSCGLWVWYQNWRGCLNL